MPKEIELYVKEKLVFKERFYKLMDLFLSKNDNKYEALLFKAIYYLQILSLFYSEEIHVFKKSTKSGEILIYIQEIIRVKDLFRSYYYQLEIFIYIIFTIMICHIIFFFVICSRTFIFSIYSYNKRIVHYLIKVFIFAEFNIILDCCLSTYCFGFNEYNPNFNGEIKCRGNDKIPIRIISAIFILISLILKFALHIYYSDIFLFSSSYYSKISCHYDLYMDIISIFNSVFMIQAYSFRREVFLVFNFVFSIVMFIYYIKYYYIYYKMDMNNLVGIFHVLYAWTSIYCLIFAYINIQEKGIIYIISCIIIAFSFINYKTKIENDIFYNNSISNSRDVHQTLYFINIFNQKINIYDDCSEDKAFVTGLIDILMSEKSKSKIYKIINEEKDEDLENKLKFILKGAVNETEIRKYVIEALFNLFVLTFDERADLYLNLSLYYLISIRNYCKGMYIFQKTSNLKLNSVERFASERLKLEINRIIRQNLKPFSDQYLNIENVDVSMYFKYDAISHNFFDEISKEMELSLEFWRDFRKYSVLKNYIIDYNKVFKLTDQIKTTQENVVKMWEELLKIYNGVNEYFYFYNDYIEQIIDDNLKKKDLDSLKRKSDAMVENINNNYYMVLFHKDTGIIIANADKGSEGIIKHCNKRIQNIFGYKLSELKGENVTKLMPKLFEHEHSEYIKNYFQKKSSKYIEKQDFKTFAKDKFNCIIQIRLGLKLFPILNYNVFMAGIIVKENMDDMDDMIILNKDFHIQGISQKLTRIFNLNSDHFFQHNHVPFYAICKKFINFYNMFIKNKISDQTQNSDLGLNVDNKDNKKKDLEEKESPKLKEKESTKINEIHENIEVNENIELEFEIKIPQFIIDYAKSSKLLFNQNYNSSDEEEEEEKENEENKDKENNNENIIDSDDDDEEDQEKLPLMYHGNTLTRKNQISKKTTKKISFAKIDFTQSGTPYTPTPDNNIMEDLKAITSNEKEQIDHRCREQKVFTEVITKYINLFEGGKFNELEDLIDLYNKNSSFKEYKFNFAFDKNYFGNNQILFIVRCIDNQMDEGQVSDKSFGEINPSSVKYKKEKVEAIKPLFELVKQEQEDIVKLYDSFLKLSMENLKFKELLEAAKRDIDELSKIHGDKKEEIFEDENASQTSQAGFDNGLVKKNKIEEVKAKLFNSSNNFMIIKYIRLSMALIALFALVFSIVYILEIAIIDDSLENITIINLYLLQTSFWTTEIVSSFISLKFILDVKMGYINLNLSNINYEPLIEWNQYNKGLKENILYLYDNLIIYLGEIEMKIPDFLSSEELRDLYWDNINVSYVDESFRRENRINNESYPSAMNQFLCNCKRFLKINNSENYLINKGKSNSFESFYNYTTYLIIENGYNSIIPEQLKKIKIMTQIFSDYNNYKKVVLIIAIAIFAGCTAIAMVFFILMIRVTNKAMTKLFKKVSKIKYDKIEERIKKLELFNANLNLFREKDLNNVTDESKIKSDNNANKAPSRVLLYNKTFKTDSSFSELTTKKSLDSNLFSSGYNLEEKKYIPLTVLNEYFIHTFILIVFFCTFLILIFVYSNIMIKDINSLLLIQRFFYGQLINTNAKMIEMKCYISNCNNKTIIDIGGIDSYSNIDQIVIGLKNFKEINYYYNNKILLNACEAVKNDFLGQKSIEECANDTFISKGNNTDNLIQIIENQINDIYLLEEMNNNNSNFKRSDLFISESYQIAEYIYYNYVYGVDKVLGDVIKSNLVDYLNDKKRIIITLILCLIITLILYACVFMLIYVPRLIHFINVTRSVIKIIPTSIIVITQDLEKWIESKYNNNFSF